MNKKWYHSRMLWTNLGALVTSVGVYVETGSPAAVFPALLSVMNIVLRLVTKTPLEL